jgi:hypothetical protein
MPDVRGVIDVLGVPAEFDAAATPATLAALAAPPMSAPPCLKPPPAAPATR